MDSCLVGPQRSLPTGVNSSTDSDHRRSDRRCTKLLYVFARTTPPSAIKARATLDIYAGKRTTQSALPITAAVMLRNQPACDKLQ